MITWSNDRGLDTICRDINKHIRRFEMRDYYIFGLQQDDRPHVRISPVCPPELQELFDKSGYILEVKNTNTRYCASCDDHHSPNNCHCDEGCHLCDPDAIIIGIRRDIRRSPSSTRKLIKTIIFAVEGRLILNSKSKISLGRGVVKSMKAREANQPSLGFMEYNPFEHTCQKGA